MSGYIDLPYPVGVSVGDVLVLHLRSEAVAEPAPSTSVAFTQLAVSGDSQRWDVIWQRVYDGSEGETIVVSGLDADAYHQAQCFAYSGADMAGTPVVVAGGEAFSGFYLDNQIIDVDAVVTTVNASVVMIGWGTFSKNIDGPGPLLISGTVDEQILLYDNETAANWTVELAVAGTAGPWQIDRDGEEPDFLGTPGGAWWTLILQPVASDPAPVLVEFSTAAMWPVDPPPGAPPERTLAGPNGETVVIGGATLEEQDALAAAQLAAWAAQTVAPDFAALVDGWLEDWDAADTSGETDLVQELIAEWIVALPVLKSLAEGTA